MSRIKENVEIELTPTEFFAISRELEQHHAVFYQLWELGRPMFSSLIDTAAVTFDKYGNCNNFLFNPQFWQSLTPSRRNFILCHECLHVLLRHGIRGKDCENREGANVAMDVVINEMLCEQFGFSRQEADPKNELCWLDTIFKNQTDIEAGQNFEYYYNHLPDGFKLPEGTMLVDIHDFLQDGDCDKILNRIGPNLSEEDKKKIRDIFRKQSKDTTNGGIMAGTEAMGRWLDVGSSYIRPKQKWETVVRRWMRKFLPNDFDVYEHWARVSRRITMLPDDVLLPTEMELQEKEQNGKIKVYFYLDTSGSCVHLASRFWKASKSLPRSRFDVKLFCFDTDVYPVTPKMEKEGKVKGGGATSFDILEKHIQQEMRAEKKPAYPEAVFVISDGYGSKYSPEKPENWYWFLTESSTADLIHKKSHIYRLREFE